MPSPELSTFPYDFVEVIWDDAKCETGWMPENEMEEPGEEIAYSVGWLVQKTKKHLVIGASISLNEDDGVYHFNNRQQIPRGMVKSIKVLKKKCSKKSKEG